MKSRRLPARCLRARLVLALAAALAWAPGNARATDLTASDFTLSVYAGSSSTTLDSSNLGGFFGPHECLCPDTITAVVQMTSAGQTDVGSSTITVSFYLGANCSSSATSASCVSLGSQIALTTSQSAQATFTGSQVFQSAAATTVDCTNLTAGSTTLWAILAQNGTVLSFPLSQALPVVKTAVAAPTAILATPSNHSLLVSWTPPVDASQVAGYQVLCLPRPATASTAAYETCGLDSGGNAVMTPSDLTEVCSAEVSAATTSVRLAGLDNGTLYTVAVVAIDPSGGVSAPSPQATATPQPTEGFYEVYQQDTGAASGCALSPRSDRAGLLCILLVVGAVVALGRGPRGRRRRKTIGATATRALLLLIAFSATARAQVAIDHRDADWPQSPVSPLPQIPDWGIEIGVSLYRPAVDSEFSNGKHPFAETFGSSRRLLSEAEVDRYVYHRYGTWGVGLRGGYYRVTGVSFLADWTTRSGDQTALRLIPFALSLVYKADRIPGLKRVPLIPYLKAGLDGVAWTASSTGGNPSHTGFTPGWHTAAGVALGLNFLGMGSINPGALADPCALFFEWDYAAIDGLGFDKLLHVGDSTWFAGVTFDI